MVIPKINLHATFASSLPQTLLQGDIALVTQSGGVGEAMLSYFAERDLGLRAWISCGNGADLEISDYLDCFSEDSATRIICLLMEGVRNGDCLKRALAKAADARKPVVAIKLGRSEVGAAVARSHTGTLVGSDEVYNAVFSKFGVLRVNDIEELMDVVMAIDWQPLPNGHKIGVVSGSGGQNGMIADACAEHGLELPKFSEETQKKLEELLKVRPSNPIDYFLPGVSISQESLIAGTCAQIMAEDDYIDAVVIANNCLGEHAETFAKTISGEVNSIRTRLKKPVYVNWTMAGGVSLYDTVRIFYQNKVPVYPTAPRTIRAIKAAAAFSDFLAGQSRTNSTP
jgi:acyl-CoA synthetase (NDP forming)